MESFNKSSTSIKNWALGDRPGEKLLSVQATSMVLCHNHPSGNLRPSRADEELTTKLKSAAQLMDINVVDHLIVSDEGYYSFADEGMI
jgi:DNA repair protein RadC